MKKRILVTIMRVAILSSGGKDSTYSHWWAMLQGWDVLALIRCKITNGDSMTFQVPATNIVEKHQATRAVALSGKRVTPEWRATGRSFDTTGRINQGSLYYTIFHR